MSTPTFAFQHSFADALGGLYVEHQPKGFEAPELLELNRPLLEQLGLPPVADDVAARYFSGTTVPAGARPVAQAYAGHQFGHLSPQLGDGRAVLLGELLDAAGRRYDLHLKGSGRTAFSRGGDGRATLGPALRELLISEAMAHLGVPTSRVLAVVTTGEQVPREWLLPGAVLARVAASHLRVGTLEYLAIRGRQEELHALVRYAIERHYPEQAEAANLPMALLLAVAKAQAKLIARWLHVGFVHGVMNTDNVTLSGETIDYGPCAFLDTYDPDTVFSSIDRNGRYAYANQPSIGVWNMVRMAETLVPLFVDEEDAAHEAIEVVVSTFREVFNETYLSGLRWKIGLVDEQDDDVALMTDLLAWMHATKKDFTQAFRRLSSSLRSAAAAPFGADATFASWAERWHARLGASPRGEVADRMDAVNPVYIPRNHLVESVLQAAHDGDMAPFRAFLAVLADPFVERAGLEVYAAPAPADFGPYRTFCGT